MLLSQLTQPLNRYRNNLKRSSAIQQGLLNISIFLVSLFLLSLLTYFLVKDTLSSRLDQNLQQRMTMLQERISDDDEEDDDEHEDYHYTKPHEVINDGNFFLVLKPSELKTPENRFFRKTGYATHQLNWSKSHDDDSYRILVAHKEGRIFVVAQDNENDQEVLEIVMSAFMLNGLVALFLTTLLVIYLANRSHRQIRRIEYVLHHAAQGDLQQRIGLSDKNDDLSHVSTQIDTMLSRMETSVAAMSDISANIAHELKTPISRLRHDLSTALDQHEQGQNPDAALNDAYEESGYITETFDALLRIAQIEGGARRAHFTSLDMNTIIETVADIYTEVAEDVGMSLKVIETEQATTPLLLKGDKELLVQLLANLIENAIRYCPVGVEINITANHVRNRTNHPQLQLIVTDNGPGIPAAEQERVFQRLYQLDKSRSDQRGTGLGLSLVKAIVELHDAEIQLSDNHPGLKITMNFPLLRSI